MTSGYQIALKYPKCPPDGLEINPKSLPHGSKSTPNAQGVAKNCPGGSKMYPKFVDELVFQKTAKIMQK